MKNLKLLLMFATIMLQTLHIHAQSFPVETIMENGASNEKVNFLFMGDGYTSAQMGQYISDVNNVVNEFFTQAPFDNISSSFNVYAVKVPSNVSGAAYSPSNLIDNYFGSTFWYAGIERLLVATKSSTVYSVANASFPEYDQVFIIVNDPKYGGSGGEFATFSIDASATELALHEAGHSYANLADEYWYIGVENANRTANSNPATIKWKDFLNQQGVGIYQYESPGNGWYRPHQNCKMRYLGSDFCLVCQNALTETTMDITGEDASLGVPSGLTNSNIQTTSFTANWNAVASASSYDLQLWNGVSGTWDNAASTSALSYSFSGFEAGSTQNWRVRAVAGNETSAYSSAMAVSLETDDGGGGEDTPPTTPVNLSSSNVGSTSFTGNWDAVDGATSYDIQRWGGSNWVSAGTSATNSFEFTGLANGSDQWFRVRAVNSAGTSNYSSYLYVGLTAGDDGGGGGELTSPTNLRANNVLSYGFYAVWDEVSAATSYEVQIWQNGGWVSQGNTQDGYMWLYFSSSQGEYWRVRAKNGTDASAYSDWIHTQIPAAPMRLETEVKQLTVYPNPSKDFINIGHGYYGTVKLELVNLSGQLIMSGTYDKPTILLDISKLTSGSYILRLYNDEDLSVEKIIKM